MIIAIFAENHKFAVQYMMDIIGEMKYKDVDYVALQPARARLKDGTEYRVLSLENGANRGQRYHKALVHKDVDLSNREIYTSIVMGLLTRNADSIERF